MTEGSCCSRVPTSRYRRCSSRSSSSSPQTSSSTSGTRCDQLLPVPELIKQPTRIEAAGKPPKIIEEYVGRVNSKTGDVSVAHMRAPAGWVEPGQRPEFDEYTLVIEGVLRVEHEGG